jgi:PAN domain
LTGDHSNLKVISGRSWFMVFRQLSATLVLAGFALCNHVHAATIEDAKPYGSFLYFAEVPYALFMLGEIQDKDFFELREALRDNDISLIVTASPGGSVYEGLQIATAVHDKGLSTYVPTALPCSSACAFVYFAGTQRAIKGTLGVHQFYSDDGSAMDLAGGNLASRVTQYTTSEIIGILNEFGTPPFVYEKMFSTAGLYEFDELQKVQLGLDPENPDFLAKQAEVEALLIDVIANLPPPEPEPEPEPEPVEDVAEVAPDPVAAPISDAPLAYAIHYDADLFGYDILAKGMKGISLSQCQETCSNSSSCVAFTYIPETRWCWPKYAIGAMSLKANAITGIKEGGGVAPAQPLQTGYTEFTGKDLTGYDLLAKGLKGVTLEQCRAACSGSPACLGFSWVRDLNWCWPKSAIGPLTDQLGVISGVKQ